MSKSQGSDSPTPQGTGANGLGSGKGPERKELGGGVLGGTLSFRKALSHFPTSVAQRVKVSFFHRLDQNGSQKRKEASALIHTEIQL